MESGRSTIMHTAYRDTQALRKRQIPPVAVLAAALVLCLVALGGCGPRTKPLLSATNAADLSVKTGSGFYINGQGNLITNHHVIHGCRKIVVLTRGERLPATLIAYDREDDLAVLRTDKTPHVYARIETRGQSLGRTVYAAGYPRPSKWKPITLSSGFISDREPRLIRAGGVDLEGLNEFTTDYPVQHGNSGGPLLNDAGAVVGVVTSRLTMLGNIAYSSSVDNLTRLLDRQDLAFEPADGTQPGAPRDVADSAARFTYPIICFE